MARARDRTTAAMSCTVRAVESCSIVSTSVARGEEAWRAVWVTSVD
jgi:hypothetical protein